MYYLLSLSNSHVFNYRLPFLFALIHYTLVKITSSNITTVPPRRCGDSVKNEGRTEMNYSKIRGEVWHAAIVCCVWCWPACAFTSALFWVDSDLLTVYDWLHASEASKLKAMTDGDGDMPSYYCSDRKRQKHSLLLNSLSAHESGARYCSFCLMLGNTQPFFLQGQDLRYSS